MPAAAALPERTAVGSVQNTGSPANAPQAANVKAATVSVGSPVSVDAAMPAAVIASAIAA